jgi:hypothetical protein
MICMIHSGGIQDTMSTDERQAQQRRPQAQRRRRGLSSRCPTQASKVSPPEVSQRAGGGRRYDLLWYIRCDERQAQQRRTQAKRRRRGLRRQHTSEPREQAEGGTL